MNDCNLRSRLLPAMRAYLPFGGELTRDEVAPQRFSCGGLQAQRRMIDCFYCLSLWFSLPLVVWLSSGWIGLLGHWQMLAGAACLFEKIRRTPQPALRTILAVKRNI
jgi:hypothetical protein